MGIDGGSDWSAKAESGVIYMRLSGPLTRAVVDATRRLQLEALRQRSSGIGIILDVGESPSLPSAEVRTYATNMAAKYPEGILAHTTVLSGHGFLASAIRSALTGIFMLARSPYPRSVVASPVDGIRFVRARLGPSAPEEGEMLRMFWALPQQGVREPR
jgi:hypothetical protein